MLIVEHHIIALFMHSSFIRKLHYSQNHKWAVQVDVPREKSKERSHYQSKRSRGGTISQEPKREDFSAERPCGRMIHTGQQIGCPWGIPWFPRCFRAEPGSSDAGHVYIGYG